MTTTFLAITNTFTHVTVGLFYDQQCVDTLTTTTHHVSKDLVPHISELLKINKIPLAHITFVAVNRGPGPFTTLRSVIASANGLSFATTIPLVGVDGMKAFLAEFNSPLFPYTIALFNAFNKDVYFGIKTPTSEEIGYKNGEQLLIELSKQLNQHQVRFIGSGTKLLHPLLVTYFKDRAYIPDPIPMSASIEQIGRVGLSQFLTQQGVTRQLNPLYLKKIEYQKAPR